MVTDRSVWLSFDEGRLKSHPAGLQSLKDSRSLQTNESCLEKVISLLEFYSLMNVLQVTVR